MNHYDFPSKFLALYDAAVDLYAKGRRGAGTYFDKAQTEWLAANGIAPQHVYDYAEDQVSDGEPGFGNALSIEIFRRNYFLNVQGGVPSTVVLDESRMPAKSDAARGIEWLPRIIPKARAKLRGELPPSLMYCCGGDRRFFRAHDILPAEFLGIVWRSGNDDGAIIDWVAARSASAK